LQEGDVGCSPGNYFRIEHSKLNLIKRTSTIIGLATGQQAGRRQPIGPESEGNPGRTENTAKTQQQSQQEY
jgi:hypothetical protein